MEAVIIVIHLMVILALVAVVLLQRSEGGALGIGGSNAFLTSRGQGNVLTRVTTILGIVFFGTSIVLTILSRLQPPPSSILENVQSTVAPIAAPGPTAPVPAGSTAGTLNLGPSPLVPGAPGAGPLAPLTAPPVAPGTPATPAPAPVTTAPAAPAQ